MGARNAQLRDGAQRARALLPALGVARRTVTSHLEHVYTKLGVSGRTEAALFAMRHGLVDEPTDD